ncbi:MAG: antitoxin VapB family protein [Halalkalicoccus sp.]
MASNAKTVALSETAYERLKARKREGESFSDVVERLAGERSLLEIAGTGSPDDEYAKAVADARSSLDRSVEVTRRDLSEDRRDP